MRFAGIKRSRDNDNHNCDEENYIIKSFDSREEAADWLSKQYEYWHEGVDCKEIVDTKEYKEIHRFFITSSNDDAIFQWEWKRRNNFRTYKIIQYKDELEFFARAKNLFKLKKGEIIKK